MSPKKSKNITPQTANSSVQERISPKRRSILEEPSEIEESITSVTKEAIARTKVIVDKDSKIIEIERVKAASKAALYRGVEVTRELQEKLSKLSDSERAELVKPSTELEKILDDLGLF